MEKTERNNRIVAPKQHGMSISAIACKVGLGITAIGHILRVRGDACHEFSIPEGTSLRAARAVVNAMGHGPTSEVAEDIASRLRNFLRSGSVRSQGLKEADAWLEWVKAKKPAQRPPWEGYLELTSDEICTMSVFLCRTAS